MKPAARLRWWLACAFCLLLLAALIAFNHHKPRLLVLHSYAESGRWEGAFNSGLQRALARNRQPLAVRWHYMTFADDDHPDADEWAASAQRARSVIARWRPDVLLAVGEEAQSYVARHLAGRSALRVVYASGDDPAQLGYDSAARTTGVRERLPLAAAAELLAQLYPGRALRLAALGVDDATGRAEAAQLHSFDWGAHQLQSVALAQDLAQWRQALAGANGAPNGSPNVDVLLLLSMAGLAQQAGAPALVAPLALAQETQAQARPLALGLRASFVADGGALALAPAPDGLGEQAGELALRALPTSAGPWPPAQDSRDFIVALRPAHLSARGLQLPAIYHQAARAAQALYLEPPPETSAPASRP